MEQICPTIVCLTTTSSSLPFAHAQLHAGKFEGHPQRFAQVAETVGKGQVDRHNLWQVWKRELKAREVRRRNDHATITQRSRNDHATITLTEPPVLPPLQGKRPVSAPPRTAAKAEQHTEALQHCLDAVSTAFTAREVPPPSCYFFF